MLEFLLVGLSTNVLSSGYRFATFTVCNRAPAQNISDGHQLWLGGRAACEGNKLAREAVALGVAVGTGVVEVD